MCKTVQKILLDFDPLKKNILPALKKISVDFRYVSQENAQLVAEYFSVPLSKIFETASFYDLIKTEKPANISIQVCSSVNCAIKNYFEIISEIENALKIKVGDGFNSKINLETVSCLGRCGEGPIMVVNGHVYERVTKSEVHKILKEWI
jgi:NADH-quinone oxidoreductase subunit E